MWLKIMAQKNQKYVSNLMRYGLERYQQQQSYHTVVRHMNGSCCSLQQQSTKYNIHSNYYSYYFRIQNNNSHRHYSIPSNRRQYTSIQNQSSLFVSIGYLICDYNRFNPFACFTSRCTDLYKNHSNNRTNMEKDEEENQNDSVVLCYSVINKTRTKKTWIQIILEWIKNILKQLYTTVLLSIRGSEIIIRLSPLFILVPASIMYAHIIMNTTLFDFLTTPASATITNHNNNNNNHNSSTTTNKRSSVNIHHHDDEDEDEEDKVEYGPIKRLRTKVRIQRRESIARQTEQDGTRTVHDNAETSVRIVDNKNEKIRNNEQLDYSKRYSNHNKKIRKQQNLIADWTWEYFIYTMNALGPAYVKLCQWIATRRDLFPPNVCDRLEHLHDRGICHDWTHTHNALVRSFGPNYHEMGLHIEHDPKNKYYGVIGSGSAAQVYRGVLRTATTQHNKNSNANNSNDNDDDENVTYYPVAIKVLHPRFEQRVEQDLWFMQSIAELIHSIPYELIRVLNLPRAAMNFGTVLRLQSNLQCEAKNLIQFRTNFYGNGTETESSIFFPKPIQGWISNEVMVEQLVENSSPISDYLFDDNNLDSDEYYTFDNNNNDSNITTSIRKELAIPLLNAFLKMVFIDNFVHCGMLLFFFVIYTYTRFFSFYWALVQLTHCLTSSFCFSKQICILVMFWYVNFMSNQKPKHYFIKYKRQ